jgi:hypothetical protein
MFHMAERKMKPNRILQCSDHSAQFKLIMEIYLIIIIIRFLLTAQSVGGIEVTNGKGHAPHTFPARAWGRVDFCSGVIDVDSDIDLT